MTSPPTRALRTRCPTAGHDQQQTGEQSGVRRPYGEPARRPKTAHDGCPLGTASDMQPRRLNGEPAHTATAPNRWARPVTYGRACRSPAHRAPAPAGVAPHEHLSSPALWGVLMQRAQQSVSTKRCDSKPLRAGGGTRVGERRRAGRERTDGRGRGTRAGERRGGGPGERRRTSDEERRKTRGDGRSFEGKRTRAASEQGEQRHAIGPITFAGPRTAHTVWGPVSKLSIVATNTQDERSYHDGKPYFMCTERIFR